ncbi:MAG: Nif11-like leader peptide family natural product precursor [Bacillota bacterium]|nr:Nif11-like leader peptide family natural product precursor [Bacillota bacterium]
MSVENAKDFLDYVGNNPELAEKLKGFTIDELKQAVNESKVSDLEQSVNCAMPILPI